MCKGDTSGRSHAVISNSEARRAQIIGHLLDRRPAHDTTAAIALEAANYDRCTNDHFQCEENNNKVIPLALFAATTPFSPESALPKMTVSSTRGQMNFAFSNLRVREAFSRLCNENKKKTRVPEAVGGDCIRRIEQRRQCAAFVGRGLQQRGKCKAR